MKSQLQFVIARALAISLSYLCAAACGGGQKSAADPATGASGEIAAVSSSSPVASSVASPAPPRRPGHLARSEVVGVLSAGLGAFLARLEVQPVVVAGKFQGWKIVRFRAGDPLWQNTELAPADVVTRINGAPIERPEQAFSVFQNLAVARQLRVEYERAGARRELVYAIDDAP